MGYSYLVSNKLLVSTSCCFRLRVAIKDQNSKTLKPSEAFETELVLTSFRAAGCGTRPTSIDANYKSKFKSAKTCEVFETELVLTAFRAACRGTRPTLIDAN